MDVSQLEPVCSTLMLDTEHKRGIKVSKGIHTRLCFIDVMNIGSPHLQYDRLKYSKAFPTALAGTLDSLFSQ